MPPPFSFGASAFPPTGQAPSLSPPPDQFGAAAPIDIESWIHALGGLSQQRNAGHLATIKEGLMAPQTRHLGMGGEDITGKTGPYDSGGIDWLHAHGPTGAPPPVDMAARIQGNEMAQAHGATPGGTPMPNTSLPPPRANADWLPNIAGTGMPGGGEHMMLDRSGGMGDSNFALRSGGLSGAPQPGQPTILDETGVRATAPQKPGFGFGTTPRRFSM